MCQAEWRRRLHPSISGLVARLSIGCAGLRFAALQILAQRCRKPFLALLVFGRHLRHMARTLAARKSG
jgi:hypothetical protein